MLEIIIIPLIKIIVTVVAVLTSVILLVYAERRVSAFIQGRIGPNRVGPFGLFQAVADVIKLILKEDIVPRAASKIMHALAPIISLTVAMVTLAVIPFGESFSIFNLLPFPILLLIVICNGISGFENLSALLIRLYMSWRNWNAIMLAKPSSVASMVAFFS